MKKFPPTLGMNLIAEQLIFDGAATYPDFDAFYPLLASVWRHR